MSITQPDMTQFPSPNSARQIDSAAWAVFFIWVGVVMLAGVPWAWFLVVSSFVVLGAQVLRWMSDLKIEAFGISVGLILLAAGVWELLSLQWPLMPIVMILLGVYLLWKALSRRSA
ncbi:hypothetical protein WI560_01055 [Bradyrhizobium sp. A11]|uniref:hypothetical protein n=1 Tax=Bradyrhizobium sp. A11 TaxID=3133974 RepID=UPI00324C166F